jgi:hypothetical protein
VDSCLWAGLLLGFALLVLALLALLAIAVAVVLLNNK